MLLAFFPASVFLLSGYAESLFIALAAWTLAAVAERRIWVAAGLCALASAARPEGAILALAVVLWVLMDGVRHRQHGEVTPVGLAGRVVAIGIISVAGLFAYSVLLWSRYHDPFQQIAAQHTWRRTLTWPLHPLFWSVGQLVGGHIRQLQVNPGNVTATYLFNDGVVLFGIISFAALVKVTWRRRDLWWFVIPTAITLLLIISNAALGRVPEGEARLVMCVVPVYAVTAMIRSEVSWTALLAGSALTAAMFQVIFNTGGALT
jgi:hypothetical protein